MWSLVVAFHEGRTNNNGGKGICGWLDEKRWNIENEDESIWEDYGLGCVVALNLSKWASNPVLNVIFWVRSNEWVYPIIRIWIGLGQITWFACLL